MRPLDLALIISTGDQDIKRLLPPSTDTDRDRFRDSLRGRRLHAWLKNGIVGGGSDFLGYRIVLPTDLDRLRKTDRISTVTHEQGLAIRTSHVMPLPTCNERLLAFLDQLQQGERFSQSHAMLLDDQCNLLLTPAKIERLIPEMMAARDERKLRVRRILVFATDRITPREYELRLTAAGSPNVTDEVKEYAGSYFNNEPFMTGEVLARWLAPLFGLDYLADGKPFDGRDGARWVNLMAGLSHFEGKAGTPDHPLHRQLARHIDDAIADAGHDFGAGCALVAVTGGSNDTKACIVASAELRFPTRRREYIETEGGGEFTIAMFDKEPLFVTPTTSILARAQCGRLIAQGDIYGAWGTVSHLRGKGEDQWLEAVERIDRLFRSGRCDEGLFSQPPAAILRPGIATLLHRAFQVEAALQGGRLDRRIPDALAATTAFSEHALHLMLCRAIPAVIDAIAEVRVDDGVYLDARGAPIGPGVNRLLPPQLQTNYKPERLAVFGAQAKKARLWLREQQFNIGGPDWDKMGLAIEQLEGFLQHAVAGASLRDHRNQLSHAALRDEGMVIKLATTSCNWKGTPIGPLWNLDPITEVPGERFLSTPLVTNVFDTLGIENPAGLYADSLRRVYEALGSRLPDRYPSEDIR
ncbi:hypothetical protein [Candidatus Thiodictyon syntrophicum]|jgi:hypothetical protein|uniref:Uncharacterized protein n=1 Tax=Candidatus Thiodictyon syntrophicum TaxID=1166950 RepID=A0A2K8UJ85_9GAMM|nr:hypothetical protein [Candidatus Thiodictyon syntrophicum]AUB85643.1 hypothetical protein THSYN_32625 [Candidatus Thiodictyon syntrophicum]